VRAAKKKMAQKEAGRLPSQLMGAATRYYPHKSSIPGYDPFWPSPYARPQSRQAPFLLAPDSMTPALFIEFGFETLPGPDLGILIALVTSRARRAGAAAGAGALALERPIRVVLADPATIIANGALH
jgi:hypothetical protein